MTKTFIACFQLLITTSLFIINHEAVAETKYTKELARSLEKQYLNYLAQSAEQQVSLFIVDAPDAEHSNGEYKTVSSYNDSPVYSNGNYHLYKRLDGVWYLDSNDISEDWNGTIAQTTNPVDDPWLTSFSTGAISKVSKIHISDSQSPQYTTGWYQFNRAYNGFPVYERNGWSVYRRSDLNWVIDSNDISEDSNGTLDSSTAPATMPWLATYTRTVIQSDASADIPSPPYHYDDKDEQGRNIIDAVIVLTPASKHEILISGYSLEQYLAWRIDELNKTLERSLINSSVVRLMGIHVLKQEDFERTGKYPNGTLNNFNSVIDWLSTYRESYGADKLLMIGSDYEPNDYTAYGGGDISTYYVSFLPIEHEFGHMMGAAHCNNGQAGVLKFGTPLAGYTEDGFPNWADSPGGTRMCGNSSAIYSNPDLFFTIDQIEEYIIEGILPYGNYYPILNEDGLLKLGDELYSNVAKTWRDNTIPATQRKHGRMFPRGNTIYHKDNCAGFYASEGYQNFIQEICAGESLSFLQDMEIKSIKLGKQVHVNLYTDSNFGANGQCGGEIIRTAFSTPSLSKMTASEGQVGLNIPLGSALVYSPENRDNHFYFDNPFQFYSSGSFTPKCVDADMDAIWLMPDLVAWSSTAAIYNSPVNGPFKASFQLKTDIDTQHNHGLGFTFFFGKDKSSYYSNTLEYDELGFLHDGKGYAVRFHYTWNDISIIDGNDATISSHVSLDSFTYGAWKDIEIQVHQNQVIVSIDGNEVLKENITIDFTHPYIGFGAGTTSYTADYRVRNLNISFY